MEFTAPLSSHVYLCILLSCSAQDSPFSSIVFLVFPSATLFNGTIPFLIRFADLLLCILLGIHCCLVSEPASTTSSDDETVEMLNLTLLIRSLQPFLNLQCRSRPLSQVLASASASASWVVASASASASWVLASLTSLVFRP